MENLKQYHIVTYGCQMNKSDSERIASLFEQHNCQPTNDPSRADFIVLNTCSIKQTAEDKAMGHARQFSKLRKDKPELKIVITGCMTGRPDAIQKTTGVDFAIPIKEIGTLPELLKINQLTSQQINSYLSIVPRHNNSFQAYIPIMTGCNNFCTFCVVPYTRGREYSRPFNEVIEEVKLAVKKGAKDIMLLGQNVNSYQFGFVELLKEINKIDGEFWVRFMSSNPQDMTKELIETVASSEKLCKYIHFAVQSGNDRVLKKMNRRHTIKQYEDLCDYMKSLMPTLGLSTDIIVGFSSETDEEFKDTANLMERVGFDMAYISQYSKRTNTPAWRLNDDVPYEKKKERDVYLNEILKKTSLESGQKLVGKKVRVLIDKLGRRGMLVGKDTGWRTVSITNSSDESLIGKFVEVNIESAFAFGLEGTI